MASIKQKQTTFNVLTARCTTAAETQFVWPFRTLSGYESAKNKYASEALIGLKRLAYDTGLKKKISKQQKTFRRLPHARSRIVGCSCKQHHTTTATSHYLPRNGNFDMKIMITAAVRMRTSESLARQTNARVWRGTSWNLKQASNQYTSTSCSGTGIRHATVNRKLQGPPKQLAKVSKVKNSATQGQAHSRKLKNCGHWPPMIYQKLVIPENSSLT